MTYRNLPVFIIFLLLCLPLKANTIRDSRKCNIHKLISIRQATYDIYYDHVFSDTLYIPKGCTIKFKGGRLSGPIVFSETFLAGSVNLKNSSISGSIRNDYFDASWLCMADGKNDDAKAINEMIMVCDSIVFTTGTYRLRSKHSPVPSFPSRLVSMVSYHIGIGRSNVSLTGMKGCIFLTDDSEGTICIYSKPRDIPNSIRNIRIRGIRFMVRNDGLVFHEFLHTIKTCGVKYLTIENCQFDDFWGDAICLSHYGDTPQTGERTRNSNIVIRNNEINGGSHHNNRNGISIVSGEDVLVDNNTIKNTSRKDMPGAIDVEPNNTAYTVNRITITNNLIFDCNGTAGGICIHSNKHGGPVHNVLIEGNLISNCTIGVALASFVDDASSNIKVVNNRVIGQGIPFRFYGKAKTRNWTFSGNSFSRKTKDKIGGSLKIKNFKVSGNQFR